MGKGIHDLKVEVSGERIIVKNKEFTVFPDSDNVDFAVSSPSITINDEPLFEDDKPSFSFNIYNLSNVEQPMPIVKVVNDEGKELCDINTVKNIKARQSAVVNATFKKALRRGSLKGAIVIESADDADILIIELNLKLMRPGCRIWQLKVLHLMMIIRLKALRFFIDVVVRNIGTGIAKNVKVEGFEKDPAIGGRMIKSRVVKEDTEIVDIDSEETHTFRLRWDPIGNYGRNNLYFNAYTFKKLPEQNIKNNSLVKVLIVKKKYELFAGNLEIARTTKDILENRAVLVAPITNKGGTDASGVVVKFYSQKEPSEETYLGEKIIHRIRAGQKISISYIWQIPEEDKEKEFSPSFTAGILSSAQLSQGYSE